MLAKVKASACREYLRSLQLPPQGYPSREDRLYMSALKQLAAMDSVPAAAGITRGINEHAYLIADIKNADGTPTRSGVVAVPMRYLEELIDDHRTYQPPLEDKEKTGPSAWWNVKGLRIVRLLTSWVDGFMAFYEP